MRILIAAFFFIVFQVFLTPARAAQGLLGCEGVVTSIGFEIRVEDFTSAAISTVPPGSFLSDPINVSQFSIARFILSLSVHQSSEVCFDPNPTGCEEILAVRPSFNIRGTITRFFPVPSLIAIASYKKGVKASMKEAMTI